MPKKRQPPAARPSAGAKNQPLARYLRSACLTGATALAVAAPLVPSERTEMTGAALPQAMLWLLLALVWFAGAWLTRQSIRRLEWIDFTALAFGGWIALSGVVMLRYGAPRPTINAVWTWISMIAAFLLLRQLLRSERELRAPCAVMIGVAVCLSVVAIHQTFVAYPQMRELYERDPDEALRQAGISAPPGSVHRKQFEDRLHSTEPNATFSLTNSLAGFIAPWLVVLVAVASSRRAFPLAGKARGLEALATWLIVVPLVICLLLTKSRSAWLATLLGLIAIAIAKTIAGGQRPATSQRLAVFAVASLVVLASALLAAIGIFDIDIIAQASRSLAFRLEYWQASLAMIADHPLFGIGPGNFQEYYTAYKLPQASETIADPHNFLLEIAAGAGVPALLAFVAIVALTGSGVFFARIEERAAEVDTAKKTPDPFALRAIYAGGGMGIPLAISLGLVTGFMPNVGPLLVGAAAGVLAVWLLRDGVEQGALPRWLIAIASGALLVNLLAAGGISFPGVAITLWILFAGGQRPAPTFVLENDERGRHGAGRWPPAIGAMIATVLLLACYVTAYQPVLARMQLSLALSDAQGQTDQSIRVAEESVAADPWSAEPRQQLAQLHFEHWLAHSESPGVDDAYFRKFETHAAAALERNRRAYSLPSAFGYCYWEAFQRTNDPRLLDEALRLALRSVELYPSDALGRAQSAWLLAAAGQSRESQREAAEALRLDELCPHSERKLAERRLFVELLNPPQLARLPAELRDVAAEPWMHRLRKDSR